MMKRRSWKWGASFGVQGEHLDGCEDSFALVLIWKRRLEDEQAEIIGFDKYKMVNREVYIEITLGKQGVDQRQKSRWRFVGRMLARSFLRYVRT